MSPSNSFPHRDRNEDFRPSPGIADDILAGCLGGLWMFAKFIFAIAAVLFLLAVAGYLALLAMCSFGGGFHPR